MPWFLPAGRAGLAPESLDEESEKEPGPARALPENAANIVSSPPWANEPPTADLGIPPWESGPWPSRRPGDDHARDGAAAASGANGSGLAAGTDSPGASGAAGEPGPGGPAAGTDRAAGGGPGAGGPALARGAGLRPGAASGVRRPGEIANPFAMPALIAGIAGVLVLPGLILGALGIRTGLRTRSGLVRSWLGIGLSVVWAAGIIIVALPGSSQAADPGCTAYQAGARAAVAQAASQLASGGPAGQLGTSLGRAAAKANAAAAQAQGVTVRSTLAAMTGDLQSALSEVTAGRPVPRLLRKDLTSDIAAAAHACG